MKTKFGIVGCGFLGNIVADAWEKGLLEDYEPVAVWVRKGGEWTDAVSRSQKRKGRCVGEVLCGTDGKLEETVPEKA